MKPYDKLFQSINRFIKIFMPWNQCMSRANKWQTQFRKRNFPLQSTKFDLQPIRLQSMSHSEHSRASWLGLSTSILVYVIQMSNRLCGKSRWLNVVVLVIAAIYIFWKKDLSTNVLQLSWYTLYLLNLFSNMCKVLPRILIPLLFSYWYGILYLWYYIYIDYVADKLTEP